MFLINKLFATLAEKRVNELPANRVGWLRTNEHVIFDLLVEPETSLIYRVLNTFA